MAKTNEVVSEKAAEDLYFAVEEAKQWIEAVTGRQILGEFREALEDGAILCELINNIKPGCIRKINMKNVAIAHLDNLKQFLTACENIGLKDSQLFDLTDLQAPGTLRMKSGGVKHTTADRRLRNVVITLYWLGRKVSQLPTYKGPQLNLEAFHDILDIPNQSYYLRGYDDNPEPIQHGGRIRSSKGDTPSRHTQLANKEPIKKDPHHNGLNKDQELTADELLANIQSAVDELLHQYHPENELLANGSHDLAPQPTKQTVKVTPTKDGSPVDERMHSPPLSSTDPTNISLTVTIPAKSGSFGLQIIGGANTALPAQIELLLPGGPAESSGLQPGDLIVSVNGHDVTDHEHVQLISLIRQSSAHGRMTLGVVRHLPELFQEESSHPIKRTESSILWEEEHLERERQQREVAMLYRNPPPGASTKKEEVDSIDHDLENILDEQLESQMTDTSKTLDELQQQLQALNDLAKKRPSPGYDSSARSSIKPVDMQKGSDDDITPVGSDEEEQNEEPIRGQGEGREADIDPIVHPEVPEHLPTNITEEDPFAPLKVTVTESELLTEVLSAQSSFNNSLSSNLMDQIVHNNVQPKVSSVTTTPSPSPSDALKKEPSPKVRQFSTPNARVVSVEYDDTFEEISGIKVKAVQRTRWTPETRYNRKTTTNRSTSTSAGPNTTRDHRGYERHEVVIMEPRGRSLSYGAPESHKVQNIRPSSGHVDRNKPPNCSHCRSPITQGPMMSIPGRKLNFHSKCLLCVVCRSPLTMGYGHTTVFLRHSLPHCASCYSTDNGIKATTC